LKWDQMTMKEFWEQTCWTKFARNVMTAITRITLAADTHEVSVLYYAWHVAASQVNYCSSHG